MPLITTLAGASTRGYGGLRSFAVAGGDFESIATYTAATAQSSIVFSGIPSTYQHLQIRAITRGSNSGISALGYIIVNDNTTQSDYLFYHLLTGSQNGAVAQANDFSSQAGLGFAFHTISNTGPANYFSPTVIDFIDYKNTNKFKNMRNVTGFVGGSGNECQARIVSSTFESTNAITKLEFILSGCNFMAGSEIALYGIKGI
jgi:hypothetical protein